ncbi:CPBP family intramembrane metalloprotease, partial [Lactobacillus sp. XV13L]|nr:CPBP family intramembrane metalloprotease [Lactobacillus sp. XV13L]
ALLLIGMPLTEQKVFAKVLLAINHSGVIPAVSFVILTAVIMHIWGFSLPKFSWTANGQKSVLIFLAIFSVLTILFNSFSAANNWREIFTKFDFTIRSTSLQLILSGIEAGLLEEWACRFVLLYLLLQACRNHLFQLDEAIIGSSLLFGIVHFTNLGTQSLAATLQQAIAAFALGVVFAASYLYTQAFWCPMLFHIFWDILSFMSSGQITMSQPTTFDWWGLAATSIIFLGVALFLLSGKRRETIKENFPELL